MFVHEVTYDLDTNSGPDYAGLEGELKQVDSCHAFQSTWFVFTSDSEWELYQRLKPFLNNSDSLRVAQVHTVGGTDGCHFRQKCRTG